MAVTRNENKDLTEELEHDTYKIERAVCLFVCLIICHHLVIEVALNVYIHARTREILKKYLK